MTQKRRVQNEEIMLQIGTNYGTIFTLQFRKQEAGATDLVQLANLDINTEVRLQNNTAR